MTARRTIGSAACLAAALILAGCSSNAAVPEAAPAPHRAPAGESPAPKPTERTPTRTEVPIPAGVSGSGCENYVLAVPAGPGALDGMGRDPVAVALGNSPLLTTFAGALMGNLNPEVNLFDAVNTGQYTVFAPTDEAFGKVSPETLEKLKGDPKMLTGVLNYHVVPGQIAPEDIVGEHKTVQGQPLTVSGSTDSLRVNDAGVVCGGIRTANATVYL
nr:fasciclin domain-containing protein [Mycobacterium sp.]